MNVSAPGFQFILHSFDILHQYYVSPRRQKSECISATEFNANYLAICFTVKGCISINNSYRSRARSISRSKRKYPSNFMQRLFRLPIRSNILLIQLIRFLQINWG